MKSIRPLMIIVLLFLISFGAFRAWGAVKAFNPSPSDGARNVSLEPVLSWEFEGDTCDLYGGLSRDDLSLAISNTTSTRFESPRTLPPDTMFYWRVDVNSGDDTIQGDVWSFETESIVEAAGCHVVEGVPLIAMLVLLPVFSLLLR